MADYSYFDSKKGTKATPYGRGVGRGGEFHTTGLKNIDVLADADEVGLQKTEEKEQEKSKAKPVSHGEFYMRTINEAKQGGQDLVPRKKREGNAIVGLTAAQLEGAQRALSQVHVNEAEKLRQDKDTAIRKAQEARLLATLPSTLPIDINNKPNPTNNPVFYKAPHVLVGSVPGVPYPVSDTFTRCSNCTRDQHCPRHRSRYLFKTDISLCTGNHARLALHWDVSDPTNSKGRWSVEVKSYFERYANGHEEHEHCKEVFDPARRVPQLAKRVIDDIEDHQREERRRAMRGARGREFLLNEGRYGGWGSVTPFEYRGRDGEVGSRKRVEREIGTLLSFWLGEKRWQGMSEEERRAVKDRSVEKEWTVDEWKKTVHTATRVQGVDGEVEGKEGSRHVELGKWESGDDGALKGRRAEKRDERTMEVSESKSRPGEQGPLDLEDRAGSGDETTTAVEEVLKPKKKELSKEEQKMLKSIRHAEEKEAQKTAEEEHIAEMQADEEHSPSPLLQEGEDEEDVQEEIRSSSNTRESHDGATPSPKKTPAKKTNSNTGRKKSKRVNKLPERIDDSDEMADYSLPGSPAAKDTVEEGVGEHVDLEGGHRMGWEAYETAKVEEIQEEAEEFVEEGEIVENSDEDVVEVTETVEIIETTRTTVAVGQHAQVEVQDENLHGLSPTANRSSTSSPLGKRKRSSSEEGDRQKSVSSSPPKKRKSSPESSPPQKDLASPSESATSPPTSPLVSSGKRKFVDEDEDEDEGEVESRKVKKVRSNSEASSISSTEIQIFEDGSPKESGGVMERDEEIESENEESDDGLDDLFEE
ncbi:hypothetical protein P153DRAFT_397552 [Dothidotthia symphoricarpi CBS 119687]|uniref:Uncharacterized protein n=1 Tax=Dothidotthia symphoricarpi CBS 119687 TaxID=1392245 RepID=A0A6A6ABE7_9PLEO|nr:uncharacterized protein P153DRAFT_397552 [Dothidotthia symphoricarpi CBS 119687]KAF2128485.1 hypothetical protein P153DRAFT_397552 [Dothidotthia symphoricarpi CBS 119687]